MEYSKEGKEMRELLEKMELDKFIHPFLNEELNPVSNFLRACDYTKPIITEGLIHTYPAKKAVNYISKALKLDVSSFEIREGENGIEKIFVTINEKEKQRNVVIAAFEYCGYFYSSDAKSSLSPSGVSITMMFEQKNQKDETGKILEETPVMYHISPSVFEGSILNSGLVPRHKNVYFKYPERVYLIDGKCEETYIFNLAFQLAESISYDNMWKNIDSSDKDPYSWTIYEIDSTKLKPGTRLFRDPNWESGIFTPDNIGPDAISRYGHFDFSEYLETDDVDTVKIIWKN